MNTFRYTRNVCDGVTTVAISGEVDMVSVDQFRGAFADLPDGKRLVVDLTGAELFGGAGVKVLFEHLHRNPRFMVRRDSTVLRVLMTTGLSDFVTIDEGASRAGLD